MPEKQPYTFWNNNKWFLRIDMSNRDRDTSSPNLVNIADLSKKEKKEKIKSSQEINLTTVEDTNIEQTIETLIETIMSKDPRYLYWLEQNRSNILKFFGQEDKKEDAFVKAARNLMHQCYEYFRFNEGFTATQLLATFISTICTAVVAYLAFIGNRKNNTSSLIALNTQQRNDIIDSAVSFILNKNSNTTLIPANNATISSDNPCLSQDLVYAIAGVIIEQTTLHLNSSIVNASVPENPLIDPLIVAKTAISLAIIFAFLKFVIDLGLTIRKSYDNYQIDTVKLTSTLRFALS